jgi:hypothetical protein
MLPTQKTPPRSNLHDLTVLLHGVQKWGKSSWCAQAEGALFLATEPGLNHLEVYQKPVSTWDELLAAAGEIAEGKHAFRTIIIDTVDNAYRMCAEYICRRYKVEHESDLEYGKGYALVNGEFHRVVNKLALLPYGLFLVSHSQEKEIETRTGKYTKIVPTLPDKARKLVLGLVDVILFCDLEPTTGPDGRPAYRRVLRTKPSTAYEAGDRTGRLPEVLDLDFAAFAAAFARGATSPSGAPPSSGGEAQAAADASASAAESSPTAATPAPPATLAPAATPAPPETPAPAATGPAVLTPSATGPNSATIGTKPAAASRAPGPSSATTSTKPATAPRGPGPARPPAAGGTKPHTAPAGTARPPASGPRAATTTSDAAARPRATSTTTR